MPKDPSEVLVPHIEALLGLGEVLRGWVIATEQSTFSGNMVVLGVTDERLLLQKFDRKLRPKDDASSIRPDELATVSADGAGHGWWTATASIMDGAALELRLETRSGETRKVTMMRGGGGMLGKLGGGEAQAAGIDALAEWLRAADHGR
jgi:hypothetical protein